MTRFSARNLARRDSSKHGSGIFVGKITATSDDEKHGLASDTEYRELRVKVYEDQCDTLATSSDSMAHQQTPEVRQPITTARFLGRGL
jgi:hypothetical protein